MLQSSSVESPWVRPRHWHKYNYGEATLLQISNVYLKDKSTETTLHEVIMSYMIKQLFHCKQYTLADFMYVQGPFNEYQSQQGGSDQDRMQWVSYVIDTIVFLLICEVVTWTELKHVIRWLSLQWTSS